ncbi:MAG: type VII toxin-antitoxin system HepT family RNase toxin [Bacillota bacterium]
MANKDKLRDKIAFIEGNLRSLRELANIPHDRFVADDIVFHASVRLLQTAIEAMIDTANHIAARERLGIPKTYAEAFKLLANAGIIPRSYLPTAETMVGFRNRAVHIYDDINPDAVYAILQRNLGDFTTFIGYIVRKYF